MTDLGPDAMDLLRLAEGADEPSPADEARIRGKLAMQFGVATGVAILATSKTAAGATTAAGGVGAGAATTAAATSLGVFGKVAIGVAVVGALGGGTAYVTTRDRNPVASQGVVAAVAPSSQGAVAATAPFAMAQQPGVPVASAELAPLPIASAPSSNVAPHRIAEQKTDVPKVEGDPLVVELALMHDAQAALGRGDAQLALAKVAEHQKQFPRGSLAPEREGTRVLALCAAGRTTEAKSAGKVFLGTYGKSPLAERVRHSCVDPSE